MNNVQNYQVEFEAVFAGVDDQAAYLLHVDGHGSVTPQDDIGYATVGLGGTHAGAHLMMTNYHAGLPLFAAEWGVFCAKKRGEAAPGVGPETDMVILNRNGSQYVSPKTIAFMEKLHKDDQDDRVVRDSKAAQAIKDFVQKLETEDGSYEASEKERGR